MYKVPTLLIGTKDYKLHPLRSAYIDLSLKGSVSLETIFPKKCSLGIALTEV